MTEVANSTTEDMQNEQEPFLQIQSVLSTDYTYLSVASAEPPFIIEQPPNRLFTVNHSVSRDFRGGNPHIHLGYYELLLFLEGNAGFFLGGKHFQLQPGNLLIIPPDTLHKGEIYTGVNYGRIVIHLSQSLLQLLSTSKTNFQALLRKRSDRIWQLSPENIAKITRAVDNIPELEKSPQKVAQDTLVLSYVSWVLSTLLQMIEYESAAAVSPRPSDLMQRILKYLDAHFTENLSVQKIADDLSISRSLLSHEFKKYYGDSLWKYVLKLRLAHSQQLLTEGSSVTSACFDSGFQNYSNYIRLFTKTFGVTPRKYAMTHRSGTVYL